MSSQMVADGEAGRGIIEKATADEEDTTLERQCGGKDPQMTRMNTRWGIWEFFARAKSFFVWSSCTSDLRV